MGKLITDPAKEVGYNQFADLKKSAEERFGKTVHAPQPHKPPRPRIRRVQGFPTPMSAQMNRGRMR